MEDIAGSDRHHPAKTVNPKADEGMGAKRASLYCKTHREGGGVPSRCCQALENCFPGSVVVQYLAANCLISSSEIWAVSLLKRIPKEKSSNHSIIPYPSIMRDCVAGCLLLKWLTLNWRVAYFGRYSNRDPA